MAHLLQLPSQGQPVFPVAVAFGRFLISQRTLQCSNVASRSMNQQRSFRSLPTAEGRIGPRDPNEQFRR